MSLFGNLKIESVDLKNETVSIDDEEKIERHDDWQTPDSVYKPLNEIFEFQLDAAATADNRKTTYWLGPGALIADALSPEAEWHRFKSVWCNPPYKNLEPWIQKAYSESQKGCTVVMLIPNARGRGWYQNIIIPAKKEGVCRTYSYGPGRIAFVDPHPGAKRSNPKQDNLLVVFTPPLPEKWSLD